MSQKPIDTPTLDYLHDNKVEIPQKTFQRDADGNIVKDANDKPIIQELVEGKEYTIDAFCDFESRPITIVPRQRIAVRNGEILKGKIVKDRTLIDDVKRLLNKLKPIGQVTIQCIKNDEKINYIEINPRFGGGAPMSIMVGADSCENIYRLLLGEKLEYNEAYKDNIMFLRFDNSIMLDEKMEPISNV